MVAWYKVRKFTAVGAGSAAGIFAYYYQRLRDSKNTAFSSWTNSYQQVSACALWETNWDCREPKSVVRPLKNGSPQEQNRYNSELEKAKPKSARHIILVRHGEYLGTGDNDETHRLTQRGRQQAKYTGQRLSDMGIKWNEIIVSTMTRAQQTANIILEQIGYDVAAMQNCSLLREGAPIPPQPPVGHWKPHKWFFQDGARIEAAYRLYFHRADPEQLEDSYTLIVGHGNVIRYFVCRALQFPPEAWLRININHASITWLTINPLGNVSIKYLGDTGFMPVNHLTNRIPRDAKNV